MVWSEDTNMLDYIRDIRAYPVLWDPTDPRYTKKRLKNETWDKIAAQYNTDADEAKRKWSSLMASYRRERIKVNKGRRSKWYAYKYLTFLGQGMDARKEINNYGDNIGDELQITNYSEDLHQNPNESNNMEIYTPEVQLTQYSYSNNDSSCGNTVETVLPSETPYLSHGSTASPSETSYLGHGSAVVPSETSYLGHGSTALPSETYLSTSLTQGTQTVSKRRRESGDSEEPSGNDRLQDDQFETAGKNIIAKLKVLPKTQRILAERLIYDVLLEGEMGTLTRESKLQVCEIASVTVGSVEIKSEV